LRAARAQHCSREGELVFGLTKHGGINIKSLPGGKGNFLPVLGERSRSHFLPAGLWDERHRPALGADRDWVSRASREVSKYWRHKREQCGKARPATSLAVVQ
jgi:hypothetical protein